MKKFSHSDANVIPCTFAYTPNAGESSIGTRNERQSGSRQPACEDLSQHPCQRLWLIQPHRHARTILPDIPVNVNRLVYFTMYPRHPERLHAFAAAAAATDRTLVLDAATAYILDLFEPQVDYAIWANEAEWPEALKVWVNRRQPKQITCAHVRNRERSYLCQLNYEYFTYLLDIAPKPGAIFLHSNGAPLGPFDAAWENMQRWLKHFGLSFVPAGTSGHAALTEIQWIIETIQPKAVMPIHSLTPWRIGSPTIPRLLPEIDRIYTREHLEEAKPPTAVELQAATAPV